MKQLTKAMIAYFEKTISQADGTYRDDDGNKCPYSKRQIASEAGLCMELGISKEKLFSMQHGSDDEKDFFRDMMLRYEVASDAMYAAKMIESKRYEALKEMFKEKSVESDNAVTVIFPNWNAPDDWEDYQELRRIGDQEGLSIRQLKRLLEKALKAGLK